MGAFSAMGANASRTGKNGLPMDAGGTPLGTLTGSAGGAGGTGFAKPAGANIQAPTTFENINAAQGGVNASLGGSDRLLSALNGANGIGNQSSTFSQGQDLLNAINGNNGLGTQATATTAQGGLNNSLSGLQAPTVMGNAMAGQGALATNLGNANGIGYQTAGANNLLNVLGQQQGLVNQYQDIANGNGPNPAQAMLNQQTGQNIANQAAMMAGQRGAGSNVGLMARQAAQQGANTQQQAVGQGATMEANQRLAALGQMGAQQQAMANTNQAVSGIGSGLTGQQQAALSGMYNQGAGAINQLQTGIGQQFGQGATTVGQAQNQLGQNAGIANNQVGNTLTANNQGIQGNIANTGQQLGAMGGFNTNAVNMQGNVNTGNTALANTGMQGQQAILGGLMSGAGSGMGMAGGGARGGYVSMAEGGEVPQEQPYQAPAGQGPVLAEPPPPVQGPPPVMQPPPGPQSSLGQYLAGQSSTSDYLAAQPIAAKDQPQPPDTAGTEQIPSAPQMGYGSQMLYQGAKKMSAGAMKMGMAAAAKGGMAHDLRSGGDVIAQSPGEKAVKDGNSYKNDTVNAKLSEGEVVIPRSIMQSKNPEKGAADFVRQVMAKQGKKAFADGGEVTADDPDDLDPTSPEEVDDAEEADAAPEPTPQPDMQEAESAPSYQPINAQELKVNDAMTQADLDAGKIHPSTFADLFAKKSTAGKIGTIFGLMVAGAGAGLTHQPNAVLEMMKKELDNDFEASKSSAANRQTFLKINQQQDINTAQIKKWRQEGKLNDAQAKHMLADASLKTYTKSRMEMNRVALHQLVMNVNKLPPGSPQRQQAESALAMMVKGVQAENFDLADRAAVASALGNAAFGQTGSGDESEFQRGQTVLRVSGNEPLAEDKASRHMPGVEGMASVPLTSKDRDDVTAGVTFQNQLKRFIDWTKAHSGDLNPKERAEGQALAAQVQGAYRMATHGGVYKEGEQGFISHVIDSTPTKFFNDIRVLPKLDAVKNESAAQLDLKLKSLGFSGFKGDASNMAAKPETKTMNGTLYQKAEGGWKKVKKEAKSK